MSQNTEFDRLEKFVSKLLNKYDKLREKNTELQTLLHQREEEIGILKNEINNADSERGDLSNRVKGLIEQIEEWESALEESQESAKTKKIAESSDDGEEIEDEDEPEVSDEKESNLQQNLFNVEPRRADDNIGG